MEQAYLPANLPSPLLVVLCQVRLALLTTSLNTIVSVGLEKFLTRREQSTLSQPIKLHNFRQLLAPVDPLVMRAMPPSVLGCFTELHLPPEDHELVPTLLTKLAILGRRAYLR